MTETPYRIAQATTDDEKRAVYRLRYQVYVQEMGRYQQRADHEGRMLVEPEDEHGRIFYATDGDEVVATARLSWPGDGPLSERQIEQYALAPFLDRMDPTELCIGERGMVIPALRGTDVFTQVMSASRSFIREQRIQLIFGACEPHLLSLYLSNGQRTYSQTNINSEEAGYLIPLVTVVEDYRYFENLGVPNLDELTDYGDDARVPDCVGELINSDGAVTSLVLRPAREYLTAVRGPRAVMEGLELSALDGLTEAEVERCLAKSNIIECAGGDRVLKKGGTARNLFVVLEGELEVRDGPRVLARIGAGEILGEMAFLLGRPRTQDVYAASESVRVLSLSEGTIRRMIEVDTQVAANLMLNIAKMLSVRLLRMS